MFDLISGMGKDLSSSLQVQRGLRSHQWDVTRPWAWQGSVGFTWANKTPFVEHLGTLMVKSAVQILGFIFPVCTSEVTRGLAASILKAHFCVSKNSDGLCFPLGRRSPSWPLQDYEWERHCGAVPDSSAVCQPCSSDVSNSSPPLTPLGSTCSCQISNSFSYVPSKRPWKADTASFEVLFCLFARSKRLCFSGKPLWNSCWSC